MKIEFLIPVTDTPGYRKINCYKKHPKLRISSVSVGKTDHKSQKMLTADFNSLIDDQSALAMENLSDGTSYRMVLNDKIVSGESWKLPVALSHAALTTQISDYFDSTNGLPSGDPDIIVWATGAYDLDLKVDTSKDYDTETKLALFRTDLQNQVVQKHRVLIFLLPQNARLQTTDLGRDLIDLGAEFFVIKCLQDGLTILAELERSSLQNGSDHLTSSSDRILDSNAQLALPASQEGTDWLKLGFVSFVTIALVALIALLWGDGRRAVMDALATSPPTKTIQAPSVPVKTLVTQEKPAENNTAKERVPPEPNTPPQPPQPPPYRLYLVQRAQTDTCVKLLLNPERAIISSLKATSEHLFEVKIDATICGLGLSFTKDDNQGDPLRHMPQSLLSKTMPPVKASQPSVDYPSVLFFFKRDLLPIGEHKLGREKNGPDPDDLEKDVTLTISS